MPSLAVVADPLKKRDRCGRRGIGRKGQSVKERFSIEWLGVLDDGAHMQSDAGIIPGSKDRNHAGRRPIAGEKRGFFIGRRRRQSSKRSQAKLKCRVNCYRHDQRGSARSSRYIIWL